MIAIRHLTQRKRTYAFAAGALLILLSLALAQSSERTRFVYLISGQAAAGLQVTIITPDGKTLNYTTGASGYVRDMQGEGKLIVTDPVTGLKLIDRMLDNPVREFKVPLPIRVRGAVSGFGKEPASITIDCGYGPRLTVSDYQRQVHNLPLLPLPGENKLEGLEMARVPSRWVSSRPNSRGRFVTEWFAAVDAPELLVFNQAGQTAVRTVPLPKGVRPRQTLLAGLLTPAAGATLEVSIDAGKTDLPLGLMMGVKSFSVPGATKAGTTHMISLLNRRDMRLGQFIAKRRQIPLELEGTTRLAGLPPMRTLRLYFVGPEPGIMAERSVTIPQQGTVRIRLTADELLGKREPLIPLTGVVRFEQSGPPVSGATVVYSSYPDRYETRTDENGRFTIPKVVANRGGVIFIDAPNPQAAPPFDRITVTRPVSPLPGSRTGSAGEQVFEIPRVTSEAKTIIHSGSTTAAATPRAASSVTEFDEINYNFATCGTNYTQDELQYVSFPVIEVYLYQQQQLLGPIQIEALWQVLEPNGLTVVQITFPQPGDYWVFLQYTPFVYDVKGATIISGPTGTFTFRPAPNMAQLTLNVVDQNGHPVGADVEVDFPGWSVDVDPYEMFTDDNGKVDIQCVSRGVNPFTNLLMVEINDPTYGCFNGFVTMPTFGSSVPVQLSLAACDSQ